MEMQKLIIRKNDRITVSGRTLHEWLGVDTPYHKWFPRMAEYGFVDAVDFNTDKNVRVQNEGGRDVSREVTDHELTLDMAKEVAMLQRTPQGKAAREYFIEVEKKWNSPEMILSRAVKIADANTKALTAQNEALAAKVAELEPKARFADAVTGTEECIGIREMAKLLSQNGFAIGQYSLYLLLKESRLLFKNKSGDYEPYQNAADMGIFRIVKSVIHTAKRSFTTNTIKVTPKGQVYMLNKFAGLRCVAPRRTVSKLEYLLPLYNMKEQ